MPVTDLAVPEPMIGGLPPLVVDTAGLPMPPPRVMPPPLAPPPPPVVASSPYKSKTKPKRPPVTLILVAVVVVILLLGGGGYFFFFKDQSAPVHPTANAKPVAPVVAIPKPPTVVIAPLPPPPTSLQPVSTAPVVVVPTVPVPTPAFRVWVNNVRIAGVRSGESTMAIVNGRLARPGDMVDAADGIVFDGVDGDQKLLSFRSRNGAVLTKPY